MYFDRPEHTKMLAVIAAIHDRRFKHIARQMRKLLIVSLALPLLVFFGTMALSEAPRFVMTVGITCIALMVVSWYAVQNRMDRWFEANRTSAWEAELRMFKPDEQERKLFGEIIESIRLQKHKEVPRLVETAMRSPTLSTLGFIHELSAHLRSEEAR